MLKFMPALFFVFSSFSFAISKKQQTGEITFYLPKLNTQKIAEDLKSTLEKQYTEKVGLITYNVLKKSFKIYYTEFFNAQEIMQFFRLMGHECYYIENDLVHTLSERGDVVLTSKKPEKSSIK